MIKIETVYYGGFEGAIQGMRLPLQSGDKSDSGIMCISGEGCKDCNSKCCASMFRIGPKDLELALKLAKSGPDHGKFLRMIHVQAIIKAPVYWLNELRTYQVGTTTNSTSMMHTGMTREFTPEDFSCYEPGTYVEHTMAVLLNNIAKEYKEATDPGEKERLFYLLRESVPMRYMYTIMFDCNYAVLRNIYFQRRNHRLQEWHTFCDWMKTLPYSELIIED